MLCKNWPKNSIYFKLIISFVFTVIRPIVVIVATQVIVVVLVINCFALFGCLSIVIIDNEDFGFINRYSQEI